MWEELDRLRKMYDRLQRRDLDGAVGCFHADVELRPAIQVPDAPGGVPGLIRGAAAVRRFWENGIDSFDEFAVEPLEIRRLADGRILMVERWRMRSRHGIELDHELTDVYSFRDGLIARVEGFQDRSEAFEAVGLPG